jgi:hypothetical protein
MRSGVDRIETGSATQIADDPGNDVCPCVCRVVTSGQYIQHSQPYEFVASQRPMPHITGQQTELENIWLANQGARSRPRLLGRAILLTLCPSHSH